MSKAVKTIYFILLHDKVGVVISNSYFTYGVIYTAVWSNSFDANKGSLFKWEINEDVIQESQMVDLVSVENSEHHLQGCNLTDLLQLSFFEYTILLAVPTKRQRYNLVMKRQKLRQTCEAKLGDTVEVLNDYNSGEIRGVLMYIGPVKSFTKDAVYFGVMLDKVNNRSHASLLEGHNYFVSGTCIILFVAAHNLNFLGGETNSCFSSFECHETHEKYRRIVDLSVGKRVFYIPDDGGKPEVGTILHIDFVNHKGVMAGVHLDRNDPRNGSKERTESAAEIMGKPGQLVTEEKYTHNKNLSKKNMIISSTLNPCLNDLETKTGVNKEMKVEIQSIKDLDFSDESIFVGSKVKITIQNKDYCGIVMWKGMDDAFPEVHLVGVELEDKVAGCTDGTLFGHKYFHSPLHKAFFVKSNQCKSDSAVSFSSTATSQGIPELNPSPSSSIERLNIPDF